EASAVVEPDDVLAVESPEVDWSDEVLEAIAPVMDVFSCTIPPASASSPPFPVDDPSPSSSPASALDPVGWNRSPGPGSSKHPVGSDSVAAVKMMDLWCFLVMVWFFVVVHVAKKVL